jgi:hypothetical protein
LNDEEQTTMHAEPVARAWWREPMLWIVIGGPLGVVVAATVTAVIAWRGADPVVAEPAAAPPMLQPALKARNHAAAPR